MVTDWSDKMRAREMEEKKLNIGTVTRFGEVSPL